MLRNQVAESTAPASPATPFATVQIVLSKQEYIGLKQQANQWHGMWQHANEKTQKLQAKIIRLKESHKQSVAEQAARYETKIADLESKLAHAQHLLFGRKSEKSSSSGKKAANTTRQASTKKRGHQEGVPSTGRKKHNNLPVISEEVKLPEGEDCCKICGRLFRAFPHTDDCDVVEVEIKAHVRRYHRRRYRRMCQCPETPKSTTSPSPPRLINRGKLGISVWVELLVNKYAYGIPINRQLESFKTQGLHLSQGTVSGGQEVITPMFKPVVEAIRSFVAENNHQWHADETRWIVWGHEKSGSHKHWLWTFLCEKAVYFRIADSRAAVVPESVIGDSSGTLVCDRYSAYKKLSKDVVTIVLAFCWAHVRRDFIDAQRGYAELEKWSAQWVVRIGLLYDLNDQRIEVLDESERFPEQQLKLEHQVNEMAAQRDHELSQPELPEKAKKVLKSLKNHWEGLTLFVGNPAIPMDNNAAERILRGEVVGRKNYYGSGSKWSADLAAFLFSILMTLKLWGINPRFWMTDFLTACANNERKPPEDLSIWLPWLMDEGRLYEMRSHDPPPKLSDEEKETLERHKNDCR